MENLGKILKLMCQDSNIGDRIFLKYYDFNERMLYVMKRMSLSLINGLAPLSISSPIFADKNKDFIDDLFEYINTHCDSKYLYISDEYQGTNIQQYVINKALVSNFDSFNISSIDIDISNIDFTGQSVIIQKPLFRYVNPNFIVNGHIKYIRVGLDRNTPMVNIPNCDVIRLDLVGRYKENILFNANELRIVFIPDYIRNKEEYFINLFDNISSSTWKSLSLPEMEPSLKELLMQKFSYNVGKTI